MAPNPKTQAAAFADQVITGRRSSPMRKSATSANDSVSPPSGIAAGVEKDQNPNALDQS